MKDFIHNDSTILNNFATDDHECEIKRQVVDRLI